MGKRMTEDELIALTDEELRQAIGYGGGKLAEQRRKAEEYFYATPTGDLAPPEVEGRSAVVVPVVRNTIEAMLPQLMVKFTGGDTVVEFEPTQPEDEQKAQNCTDYLNYLFFKKCNGHAVTYSWFKDALKLKRGICKVWWDTRDEETREEYRGLSQVELAQIMDDPEVEVIEQKSYPDEDDAKQRAQALQQLQQQLAQARQAAQQGQAPALQAGIQIKAQIDRINQTPAALLYDIACKRKKTGGKLCVEPVPPEEFIINRGAKGNGTARMVGHVFKRTMSELRSMGYKNLDNIGSGDESSRNLNAETIERLSFDDEYYQSQNEASLDESQRTVWVKELYMRVDFDGDGVAELRKVTRAGNAILDNEVCDEDPFVSICPIPEPHKFFGLSVADLCMEGQKTETGLLRASIDNTFLEVNGRYGVVEGQANLDDLLSSRPGGLVRMKNRDAVFRLDQGKGNIGETMSMLEYMKGFNEDSSGWSRLSQGNDPFSMNKPETATKSNIVTNKADMRVDLIARNFAEGFVELFRKMLKLVCQYHNKKVQIRLSGAWVDMDPREWRNQFDTTINVGLGVGSKDQQIQHLMALQNAQVQGMQIGIATPTNLYESSLEMGKAMGFKSSAKFFTKPDPNTPIPSPGAAEMQGKMQMHQAELQSKGQIAQMQAQQDAEVENLKSQHRAQVEQMKAQMQAEVDRNRQASEAQQHALKIQQDAQLEAMKAHYEDVRHQREMAFQQWKTQMERSTTIQAATIKGEAQVASAEVSAQATLTAAQDRAADNAVGDDQ